jgi:hypothetical protein
MRPVAGGQTYSLSLPGIHSVRFSGVELLPDGSGGIALDDVRFNRVVAVPEPGMAAHLIGAALSGVVLRVIHGKARS